MRIPSPAELVHLLLALPAGSCGISSGHEQVLLLPLGWGKTLKPTPATGACSRALSLAEPPPAPRDTQPPVPTSSSPRSMHSERRARFSGLRLPPLPSAAGVTLVLLKDYVIRPSRVPAAAVPRPALLSLFLYLSAADRAVTDRCRYYS